MKNHQIRARRAEGSAVSAPEYAVNCLNVDIILAKGRSDVRELSVRLYTSAYRLMGVAARQASSSKAIRTWHFEVSSSDAWTGGTYRAFVYVNGVPSWKAELFLYTGEGIDSSARLESLEPSSPEMLFAGRLAFRSWWPVRPKCSLPGGWLSGRGGLFWKAFILTRISSSVSWSKSGSLRKI